MSSLDRSAVKIRRITSSDVDGIMSLQWAEIPNKEMIYSQRGGRLDASFLAEVEGRVVGFVLARLVYVGRPMVGVGQLNLIAVRPDYQHKGIGRMLLDGLQTHCKGEGIQTMRALVQKDNEELRAYFARAGFSPSAFVNYDKACD